MSRWYARRAVLLGSGAVLWWWAVVRLTLGDGGVAEGTVVTGGWGLSLLPVHCAPRAGHLTRASRPRRSDAGSGPS
ncbi:hypothetical protein ACFY0F_27770 [Streptomyces sp. NPDC001544]|uniref:hypothetical protein n=1 Tax=Streptomyces sp. NPDC001544 TaxID=3364584 RepID=UPI0036827A7C